MSLAKWNNLSPSPIGLPEIRGPMSLTFHHHLGEIGRVRSRFNLTRLSVWESEPSMSLFTPPPFNQIPRSKARMMMKPTKTCSDELVHLVSPEPIVINGVMKKLPIPSMYDIFPTSYHKKSTKCTKILCTIHGWYWI